MPVGVAAVAVPAAVAAVTGEAAAVAAGEVPRPAVADALMSCDAKS